MKELIKCGLDINGVPDQTVRETFNKTLNLFENQDYKLREKIKFLNFGKIRIVGRGKDGRCAFCEYFRKVVIKYFRENSTNGRIEMLDCPFNLDKRINYTPEVQDARWKLLKLLADAHKKD